MSYDYLDKYYYSLILILSLCSAMKVTIRQAMYRTSITTLTIVPQFNVSTKKFTTPVKTFASKKNPNWLKSTADTKHRSKYLTCFRLSPLLVEMEVEGGCGRWGGGRGRWRTEERKWMSTSMARNTVSIITP